MKTTIHSVDKVRHLLFPESIAIVGASPRRGGWSEIIYRNLKEFGYTKPVYLVNPRYESIWGEPCYPNVSSLPGKPDHLVVLVPSSLVNDVLAEGASSGARSATIYAGGFGEGGDEEGKRMLETLRKTIQETGLAVSGPNCLGNLCGESKLVTITDRRLGKVDKGAIAVVGQSGGIVTAISRTLADRGNQVGCMITTGNSVDLDVSDYIEYFVEDAGTQVIVVFIESVGNSSKFLSACGKAKQAGKPIIAVKIGGTEQSRAAAVAHTGALAGSLDAFDAVAGEAGVIRVDTLDEVIETVEYLVHADIPKGTSIGIMTISGGFKELLLEAAGRNGIQFKKLTEQTERQLHELLPVGTSVGNPLDCGWGGLSSQDIYFKSIELLLGDPNVDVLLIQEEVPRTNASPGKEDNLRKMNEVAKNSGKPIAVVSMISHNLTDYSREFKSELPHLPFLQESDKSLKTVKRIAEYGLRRKAASPNLSFDPSAKQSAERIIKQVLEQSSSEEASVSLDEVQSKEIFRMYGIPTLTERIAHSEAEAVERAAAIGFPVVLKGVSQTITHKSDAGIVKVGIKNEQEVVDAYRTIAANGNRYGERLDKVLVAPMAGDGIEVVVGVKRDPEMGPIVVYGNGGIWLELYKDVAFGSVPIDPERALQMVEKTKTNRLLQGYRGDTAKDRESVIDTLVRLSHLAHDLESLIESVDINPFRVFADGEGGAALDGLIVLRKAVKE